jgi:hypothetical protein
MSFVGIVMFSGFARLFAVNLWFTGGQKKLLRLRRRMNVHRRQTAA